MQISLSRRTTRKMSTASLAAAAAVALLASVATTAQATSASADSRPSRPVIGGTQAPDDAYPFMVAILKNGEHHCGGSLVDPQIVMTAAHCVTGVEPQDVSVAVGRTVLSDTRQGQERRVRPSEGKDDKGGIVVHPRYLKGDPGYDLAFLKLDKPVEGITPIKLPTPGTDALIRPGQQATVIGWGTTDTLLGHAPDRLRQVDVPLLSHNECRVAGNEDYKDDVNLCAGTEGKDSCWGDSGGPLFRQVPGRQDPIQIGVVSRGDGCAGQGAPGIYTSLSSTQLWKTLDESAEGTKVKMLLNR